MSGDRSTGGPAITPESRLRRGLLGVRPSDVRRALATRDAEIEELRRELAALWQTYAQHDRAIREALTGTGAPLTESSSPHGPNAGDSAASAPASAVRNAPEPVRPDDSRRDPSAGESGEPEAGPSASERRAAIEAQLGGLNDALTAIEQATQTLEKAYKPKTETEPTV